MRQGFVEHSGESDSVEWYTPPDIFETLNLEFDLDPASPENKPEYIPVKSWYSIKDNGLEKDWYGRVWLNPPYSRKEMGLWLEKFINHGNGIAILFKKGRIKFLLNGKRKAFPSAPSIFLAMGEECCNAIKKFEGLYVDLKKEEISSIVRLCQKK
jgi:hypothetical protein